MFKVFIDGREGTTGLRIIERLSGRSDIELLTISDELRKDPAERKKFINAADYVFLCLPDAAAIEAASLCDNDHTVIIDASTAHRTNPAWAYGFPELSAERRAAIASSKRIANPGCHASGFISLASPLVQGGLLDASALLTAHSITGYSGGGKKMIAQYNESPLAAGLDSPRQYGLTQKHKHLPEMKVICGLDNAPVFNPIVSNFYAGMVVTIPLHASQFAKKVTAKDVHAFMSEFYAGQNMIHVMPFESDMAFLDASTIAGRDDMEIYVFGHDSQIVLASRFDNLGKGASGAAVQCMNISMGLDERTGLNA